MTNALDYGTPKRSSCGVLWGGKKRKNWSHRVDGQICTLFTSSVFALLKLSLCLWRILERDTGFPETFWAPVADSFQGPDAGTIFYYFHFDLELTSFQSAASLSLDLEGFIINSIAVTKTISTSIDEVRRILLILDRLRFVLSTLITPGLNANVDSICYGILSASPSSAIAGLSRRAFYLACSFL